MYSIFNTKTDMLVFSEETLESTSAYVLGEYIHVIWECRSSLGE